jgi:hypothetical protein
MQQGLVTKQNNVSKKTSFYVRLRCFETLFCFGKSLSASFTNHKEKWVVGKDIHCMLEARRLVSLTACGPRPLELRTGRRSWARPDPVSVDGNQFVRQIMPAKFSDLA